MSEPVSPRLRTRIPFRQLAVLAAVGALATVAFVLYDLSTTSDRFGGLIPQSPTNRHLLLPWDEIGSSPDAISGGHDGRYFYALARSLPDIQESSAYMDRPMYRTMRIFFPALSKVLHPVGVGSGLIWTMFGVGIAGVFLAGFSSGAFSSLLGGKRTWLAAVPGLYYGSWVAIRITVPDPLAFGLVMSALVLSLRGRHRWAMAAAIAAVLTKETTLPFLLGYALWKRDRRAATLFAVPTVILAGWAAYLRLQNWPMTGGKELEGITVPLWGLYESLKFWGRGFEPLGWICLFPSVVVAIVALVKRGLRHPVGWMLLIQLVLLLFATADVLAPERNASRITLPILTLAIIALVTPHPPSPDSFGRSAPSPEQPRAATGRDLSRGGP